MLVIEETAPNTLTLRGRLDAAHADRCYETLVAQPQAPVLELGDLKYIASAGISALVRAYRQFDENGGQKITLRNLQPQVKMVLHFSKIEDLFVIE